jgi:uncharacterized protein (DUF1800 family)
MDDADAVRWIHRRAGLGLTPAGAAASAGSDPVAALAALTSAPPDPDPWSGLDLDPANGGRVTAIRAWIAWLMRAEDTYRARRTLMLHGWLVSALDKVADPRLMVTQARLLASAGGGSYPDLLRSISVDPAMLVYLDGETSTGQAPNENYGRELLELFALGVGRYDEADVQAAATALTGWVVRRRVGDSLFRPERHDPTPQVLLGVDGVADVNGVVDAVVAHPDHATFVADRIVREYLGDPAALDGVTEAVAEAYLASGRQLDAAIAAALREGLAGASTRLVLAPMPWLALCVRSTGVDLTSLPGGVVRDIRSLGQLPMLPPNVGGWPRGAAWFASDLLVARSHLAAAIAESADPASPAAVAATDGDLDALAAALCLAEPFGPSTASVLRAARTPSERLTLALLAPEQLTS